jgi:hypothetical protein
VKTILACLILIAAALWLGSWQRERIRELRQSGTGTGSSATGMANDVENPNFRTKSRSRATPDQVTVDELFDEIMRIHNAPEKLPTQYSFAIFEIASENSELLRKMSLLDAALLEQLIERIHASPEPKNSPLPLQKGQEISLCLIAMCADDPRRALDILIHAKERFGDDQARCLAGEQLLSYVLANLAKRDPAAALEPLRYLVTEWPGDSFGRYEQPSGRTGLYSLVARERPDLAVEAALQLPPDIARVVFGTMGAAIEDDSQRTALVNSLRMEANRHPDLVKSALQSISGRYTYHQVQPEAAMKWIESLNLTDAEKLSLAPILFPDSIYRGSGKDQWPQIEWMVSYLPESEEKKRIIREAVIHTPRSSPERIEFLKLHGIDPGEN